MPSPYNFSKTLNPAAGWYRGDFHVHTHASDGDYPPALVAEIAKAEGLDFITLTDHNSLAGLAELKDDLDFLVIPGVEATFKRGHFNALDLDLRAAWTERICVKPSTIPLPAHYQTINQLLQKSAEDGHLNAINHPHLQPWAWNFNDTNLRLIHCVELWNDLYYPQNELANFQTLKMWTKWLNAGHRITAIGGSDYHYPPRPEEKKSGERLGYPSTFVYADELSTTGIMAGLRQGRVYLSKGTQINLKAEINGEVFGIGADVGEKKGKINFSVSILSKSQVTQAKLIKKGQVFAEVQIKEKEIAFSDTLDGKSPLWYRLELYDAKGQILLITNPIFTGAPLETTLFKYSDFL